MYRVFVNHSLARSQPFPSITDARTYITLTVAALAANGLARHGSRWAIVARDHHPVEIVTE